jgi:hypothetical protein
MAEPRRLVERESVPRELEATAQVLRRLPATPDVPRAQAEATWDAVLARSVVRAARPRWPAFVSGGLGFAAAAAVLTFIASVAAPRERDPLREEHAPSAQQGSSAEAQPVTPLAGARLVAATERGGPARLVEGQVRGRPSVRATAEVLASPHGTVTWRDARFLLDVTAERTLLFVEAGEVVWRGADGERVLHVGAELRAPPLVQALPPVADCAAAATVERVACLEALARGDGLAAENALFELGWLELQARPRTGGADPALRRWETYLARFPEGALEAEARAMRVLTLAEAGRTGEAREELRRFHAAMPDDPLLAPLDGMLAPPARGTR